MFYLLIYAKKKNMVMACRNVKTQKHKIVSSSIQRAEMNWPSYYSVCPRNSSFLSPFPRTLHVLYEALLLKWAWEGCWSPAKMRSTEAVWSVA